MRGYKGRDQESGAMATITGDEVEIIRVNEQVGNRACRPLDFDGGEKETTTAISRADKKKHTVYVLGFGCVICFTPLAR